MQDAEKNHLWEVECPDHQFRFVFAPSAHSAVAHYWPDHSLGEVGKGHRIPVYKTGHQLGIRGQERCSFKVDCPRFGYLSEGCWEDHQDAPVAVR
jgi:hypothetical protein